MSPQVLRQSAGVAKCLLTRPTPVRPFAAMRPNMRGNTAALAEPPVAYRTPERLFAAVGSDMRGKVRRLAEALVAVGAAIRLFAAMRAQVCFESGGARVGFAADPTEVWAGIPQVGVVADGGCFVVVGVVTRWLLWPEVCGEGVCWTVVVCRRRCDPGCRVSWTRGVVLQTCSATTAILGCSTDVWLHLNIKHTR